MRSSALPVWDSQSVGQESNIRRQNHEQLSAPYCVPFALRVHMLGARIGGSAAWSQPRHTLTGSDIHVMLAKRFRVPVDQSRFPRERRSTGSHGHSQGVSTMSVIPI